MRIVASDQAVELIGERGGRLYVWITRSRCCNGLQTLRTATEPQAGRAFGSGDDSAGFELFLPAALGRLPDELHVEVGRFRGGIHAYWNGCAWIA